MNGTLARGSEPHRELRIGATISGRALRFPPGLVIALTLLSASCASRLIRTTDGNFKVDGPDYAIAALSDGGLMPPGWNLTNYEESDGRIVSRDSDNGIDLRWERIHDDGALVVETSRRPGWGSSTLAEFAETDMSVRRGRMGIWSAMGLTLNGLWLRDRPGRAYPVPGGEGYEMLTEVHALGDEQPLAMSYQFWFRPASHKSVTTLIFAGPAATFNTAALDVIDLVKRISFP